MKRFIFLLVVVFLANSPLFFHSLGAQTDGATSNMGWFAMLDCLAVLKNEEPKYRVH